MHIEFVKEKMDASAADCQKLTANGCKAAFNINGLVGLFPKWRVNCLILIRNLIWRLIRVPKTKQAACDGSLFP